MPVIAEQGTLLDVVSRQCCIPLRLRIADVQLNESKMGKQRNSEHGQHVPGGKSISEDQTRERERLALASEPSDRTRTRIAEAVSRGAQRKARFTVAMIGGEGNVVQIGSPHQDG